MIKEGMESIATYPQIKVVKFAISINFLKNVEPTNSPVEGHIPWPSRLPVVVQGADSHHYGSKWDLWKLHAAGIGARSRALE